MDGLGEAGAPRGHPKHGMPQRQPFSAFQGRTAEGGAASSSSAGAERPTLTAREPQWLKDQYEDLEMQKNVRAAEPGHWSFYSRRKT